MVTFVPVSKSLGWMKGYALSLALSFSPENFDVFKHLRQTESVVFHAVLRFSQRNTVSGVYQTPKAHTHTHTHRLPLSRGVCFLPDG